MKTRILAPCLIASTLPFLSAFNSLRAEQAKAPLDRAIESLLATREIKEVAISPDGTKVTWVERVQGKNGAPSPNSAIYLADLATPSAPPRRITAGLDGKPHAEHSVAWSPDGQRVVFLSDAVQEGQLQLYLARAKGGPARRLSRMKGFLATPRWSPDGKKIAFLFIENAPRAAGPLQAMTKDAGVVEERVFEQRLATLDLATGRIDQLSPPDLYVYEYDWSPDAAHFVVTAAHGAGDANWYVAALYTIVAKDGKTKSIFKPRFQVASPHWSPDGKEIAFIGGLMSDEGNTGGDVFVLPAGGGEPRNITPNLEASAGWLAWLSSSKQIIFLEVVDGSSGIATVDVANGAIITRWTGAETVSASTEGWGVSASLARDGTTSAVIRQSFARPPEVWTGPVGEWKQLTHLNSRITPSSGEARSLHWTSEGLTIQGWLLLPRGYDPHKRFPLVVYVHGGPGAAALPHWPGAFNWQSALSSQDYFVLMPNPRGSFGEGEAFTRANVKNFGYGDFRDILAGVDQAVKEFPVDENRIGIAGWSYGGFMTMWAVTQTQRFRAAVAGAGIANWQSYYGQNDIDQWMIPFFGASVYDDPQAYARSSPITFIKNVKTPTLVLVGDSDGECPPPQSYEFWHALKTLGVETQLVVYPNEGHEFSRPEDERDLVHRTIAWFDRHLQ